MQITIEQLTLKIERPMSHLTKCWKDSCPYGEDICCFECGELKCIDRCEDIDCHVDKIRERVHKRG